MYRHSQFRVPYGRAFFVPPLVVLLVSPFAAALQNGEDRPIGEIVRPPLIEAARRGSLAEVKSRLAKGDPVDLRDQFHATALGEAAWEGHVELVKLSIDRGADVNAANQAGCTGLMGAAVHDHLEIADALLQAGAGADAENQDGDTALILAARSGSTKVIKALAKHGVRIDARASNGRTALVEAAACGQPEAVNALLGAGADINLPDRNGRTPLISAIDNRRAEVVAELLKRGVDVKLADGSGEAPLKRAEARGDDQIVALLAQSAVKGRKDSDRSGKKRWPQVPELSASNIDGNDMNVDPKLTELQFTFDRPMNTRRYHLAIVNAKKYGVFPELVGDDPISFRDERTLVLRVKLEPDVKYGIGLNEVGRLEFRSQDGVPLEPLVFYFQSGRASNEQSGTQEPSSGKLAGDGEEADVWKLFHRVIDAPRRENYVSARKFVIGHASYKPHSSDLAELSDTSDESACQRTLDTIDQGSPNLLFSPRAHLYAAMAAEKLGDDKRKEREILVANRLIQGILATGDGSSKQPYLILRSSDEKDILMHLKKQEQSQSLIQENGCFDVIRCTDGSDIWFDISNLFGRY